MKNRSRQLDALMLQLDTEHQQAVVDYTTFLVQRYKIQAPVEKGLSPADIVRPEQESVIAAIKRLKKTYFMLDTDSLLDQTSSLMGKHILRGRQASEVIDELQSLFEAKYDEYLNP